MTLGRGILVVLGAISALGIVPGAASAATITVSSSADGAPAADPTCTLREAVINSNLDNESTYPECNFDETAPFGNDTITVTASVALTQQAEDDTATSGDLDVTGDLTITGTGNPTIDQTEASDTQRVFEVPGTGDSLTLNGLTVTGGTLGDAAGSSELEGGNVRFVGGLGDQLNLNNVNVTNGMVVRDPNTGFGGNIWASGGAVSITNTSQVTGGVANGIALGGGQGGGIHVAGSGTTLLIADSAVSNNSAGVNSGSTAEGGGIFFAAGGPSASLALDTAAVSQNAAGGGATPSGSGGDGGGIFVQGAMEGPVTVTDGSEISDNDAGGGSGDSPGRGGGLFVQPDFPATVAITDSEVSLNDAGGNGGSGTGTGGGIRSRSPLTLTRSEVADNEAGVDPGADPPPQGVGAGVAITDAADLDVEDSEISGNSAGERGSSSGGGVDMDSTGNMTVTDSTIASNAVGESDNLGTSSGGGINRVNGPSDAVDAISGSTIDGNQLAGGFRSRGGGVNVDTAGTFTIDTSAVTDNSATAFNTPGEGGGLAFNDTLDGGGTFDVTNVTVSGNSASSGEDPLTAEGAGGGLAIGTSALLPDDVNLTNSTIASNVVATLGTEDAGGNLFSNDNTTDDTLDLQGTIVSGGSGPPGSQNCGQIGSGAFQSLGGSVEGPPSTGGAATNQCELNQASDRHADPLLGPLMLNPPGTTETHALGAGSPAIDLVPGGLCPPPATDQRGVGRPLGAACDAGAFEAAPPTPPTTTPPAVAPPVATENPRCPVLRKKLKKAKKQGKKKKVKKIRKKLRRLGC